VQPLPTWPEVCGRDVRDDGPSVDDAADIDGTCDGGASDYYGARDDGEGGNDGGVDGGDDGGDSGARDDG